MRYRRYFLIPEIRRTGRHIHPLVRGDHFVAADFDWEVMWPYYAILEQIGWVRNMVRRLRDKISRIREELSEQQRRRFDEIYEELSISFAREGVANHRKSMEEGYAIEEDKIQLKLKAKRLHYLYAITYSPSFLKGWKGDKEDLETARRLIKNAWMETRLAIAEREYGD